MFWRHGGDNIFKLISDFPVQISIYFTNCICLCNSRGGKELFLLEKLEIKGRAGTQNSISNFGFNS